MDMGAIWLKNVGRTAWCETVADPDQAFGGAVK